MVGRRLFGDRPAGAVTIVETPVSRSYARKARITFLSLAPTVGLVVVAVLATLTDPATAVALGLAAGVVVGLAVAAVVQLWPVLRVLWHWAFEIATAGLLLAGAAWLASVTAWSWASATVAGLAGGVAVLRPLRRRLVALWWCALVRHRLRLCFAEFIRSANRVHPGSLPLILVARPTPAGERVWVWLRPGLDLADIEGKTGRLAVACWAGEVRVVRASTRYAALVRVDVTRRDPLTSVVGSPLLRLVPADVTVGAPVSPGMPPLALDLPDVPEPEPTPPRGGRR